MRILEGKYRRRPLQSFAPSPRVCPTARRLRETLFDFLGSKVPGSRFLDLCAGSGAVGLEALSRGASHVTFVERSQKICGLIKSNLERCEVPEEQAEIVRADAIDFLNLTMRSEGLMWEIAFFDPPYAIDYTPVMDFFGTGAALKRKGGVLVVEHHCEYRPRETIGILRRWRVIRQGESCLSFYERK